jgi:cell division protein FtsW
MSRSSDTASGGLFSGFDGLRWDLWLASSAIGLVLFGLVMVYSASGFEEGSHRLLLGQFQWAMLGFAVMALLTRIDYHHLARPGVVYGLLAVCVALLVAVLFFPARNGAHRWMRIHGWSAQPSELAKLALILFLARFLSQREDARELKSFGMTVLPACVVAGLLAALIMKEPDLGTTAMLGVIFLTVMFVAGVPSRHLLKLAPLAMVVIYWSVFRVGWRLDRVLTFLHPDRDPQGRGFQVMQSLIAVGSGGLNGRGLGDSIQKLYYLPEPHADFIFAVVAEELGVIGAATVVAVFCFLLWRGLSVSYQAPETFGRLLGLGLTTMIIAQAFFNISVVLSLVPTKGIPLPFISAGGTSLVLTLGSIGILLNISEHGGRVKRSRDGE